MTVIVISIVCVSVYLSVCLFVSTRSKLLIRSTSNIQNQSLMFGKSSLEWETVW